MTRPRQCKICDGPHHEAIDRLISAGLTYQQIAEKFPGFSASTLYNHKRHANFETSKIAQKVNEALAAVETPPQDIPEDLLTYGLQRVLANVYSLEALVRTTGNIRASEALTNSLRCLLEYHRELKTRSDDDGELKITISLLDPENGYTDLTGGP